MFVVKYEIIISVLMLFVYVWVFFVDFTYTVLGYNAENFREDDVNYDELIKMVREEKCWKKPQQKRMSMAGLMY